MAPPSAISPERASNHDNGDIIPSAEVPLEPGISQSKAKVQMPKFPQPPTFADKYAERDYLKGMLPAARTNQQADPLVLLTPQRSASRGLQNIWQ
ncbi:MAG: hypothetical protein Q9180_004885, partial [Flavoplaca navasiana]